MERVETHDRQQAAHSNLHSNGTVDGLKRFCFLAGPRQQLSSLQVRSVKSFELRATLNKPDLKMPCGFPLAFRVTNDLLLGTRIALSATKWVFSLQYSSASQSWSLLLRCGDCDGFDGRDVSLTTRQ